MVLLLYILHTLSFFLPFFRFLSEFLFPHGKRIPTSAYPRRSPRSGFLLPQISFSPSETQVREAVLAGVVSLVLPHARLLSSLRQFITPKLSHVFPRPFGTSQHGGRDCALTLSREPFRAFCPARQSRSRKFSTVDDAANSSQDPVPLTFSRA